MTNQEKTKTAQHEGKYIVFKYEEEDREDYGEGMAIFQIKKNKLKEVFIPAFSFDPYVLNQSVDVAMGILHKRNVNVVYTVHCMSEFLGLSFERHYDPHDKKGEQFFDYSPVCCDTDLAIKLKYQKIKLIHCNKTLDNLLMLKEK